MLPASSFLSAAASLLAGSGPTGADSMSEIAAQLGLGGATLDLQLAKMSDGVGTSHAASAQRFPCWYSAPSIRNARRRRAACRLRSRLSEPCHVYIIHPPGGLASGDGLELCANGRIAARTALLTTPAAGKFYRSR